MTKQRAAHSPTKCANCWACVMVSLPSATVSGRAWRVRPSLRYLMGCATGGHVLYKMSMRPDVRVGLGRKLRWACDEPWNHENKMPPSLRYLVGCEQVGHVNQ